MTTVTDVAAGGKTDAERERSDPFAGTRIERSKGELRGVSPSAWPGGAKRRSDAVATRLTYGL